MNRASKLITLFSLTFACALTTAFGQVSLSQVDIYTYDEFGHGTFHIGGNGGTPYFILNLPGAIAQDPFSGMSTLSYLTSSSMPPGDVLIYSDPQQTVLSDIIRFDGHGQLFFFSQLQPGETPTLADVAQLPTPLAQFPIMSLTEGNSPFGGSSVQYGPISVAGPDADPKEFLFITEVPEPATTFLLLFGAGFFLASHACVSASPNKLPLPLRVSVALW